MTTADLYWSMYKLQARLVREWRSRAKELDAECRRWAARYDQAWADVDAARLERDEALATAKKYAAELVRVGEALTQELGQARTELGALKTQAQEMREALLHNAGKTEYGDLTASGRWMVKAAGKPIA